MFKERKRPFLGLPLSFTTYELGKDRLFIKSGVFTRREDEVRLYRITDVSLRQTLLQRLFKVGDIIVSSADSSLGNFTLKDIKNPEVCKEDLSVSVEGIRQQNRVVSREYMDSEEEVL